MEADDPADTARTLTVVGPTLAGHAFRLFIVLSLHATPIESLFRRSPTALISAHCALRVVHLPPPPK